MNVNTIIIRMLGLMLLLCVAACSQDETKTGDGTAAAPNQQRPTDVDLGHGYVRRDGAIHFIGGGATGTGADATRIDTPSPQVLKGFMDIDFGPFKTCEGLDVASFEALSEEYARDKDRVYHKVISTGVFLVIQLPEADPASFEVLASNVARDKNHVWYYERTLPGVDSATFELVDGGMVFKDKDSVHYQHERIAGADPGSFKHLGSGYYADKSRVYWCDKPIADADPVTFRVLGDSFIAKDGSRVYRSGQHMSGFDVASLELILHNEAGYQICSDKNGIHVNKLTFPRSKPGDVEVIDDLTVKADDLVLLVENSRFNPVTVFRQDGKLMAETPAYDFASGKTLGTIAAEVTDEGLKDIKIEPLPGSSKAPAVPDWQVDILKNPQLITRMIEAGKRIK
jgi:hypothetical protein